MTSQATTIDRRRLLLGTGATAAGLGALSVLPVESIDERVRRIAATLSEAMDEWNPDWRARLDQPASDPLADTIAQYYAKMAEFMAIPNGEITRENEDALVAATYGPLDEKLWHATPPATSNRGVAEAIRYALEEHSLIDRVAEAILISALAFLDQERVS
ncbi:hypothetical protein NKH85_04950 [Mesorhizobium sp. M0924]|uniref:hypothetical protein n=1 Tax=unclassified Mesorhizobium TaxID=325217 RepID=UPI0033389BBC